MNAFRMFLVAIFTIMVIYTVPVVMNHGLNLVPIFFGDIFKMEWPGQFNLDFLGFLLLSAFWTAWRGNFSIGGLGLAVLALFFGIPFLTAYLLVLSFRCNGNIQVMMMGELRALNSKT